MRLWLILILALLVASTRIEAACIDPSKLDRSTVSIERVFGEDEQNVKPGEYGIGGTGWFFSPQLIVTAAHVAEAMHLSESEWKEVEFRGRESKSSIPVRIRRLVGSQTEKIAVLELKSSFSGAAAFRSGPSRSFRKSASSASPIPRVICAPLTDGSWVTGLMIASSPEQPF